MPPNFVIWIKLFCAKSLSLHFFWGFQPCLDNLSLARLRFCCSARRRVSTLAWEYRFASSIGLCRVAARITLRPERRRQMPHERVFLKQKYFTRSGVSSDMAPTRGKSRILRCVPIRQRKPWHAFASMCCKSTPTHSWNNHTSKQSLIRGYGNLVYEFRNLVCEVTRLGNLVYEVTKPCIRGHGNLVYEVS